MTHQLWIEPVGSIIIARIRGIPTEAILKECQERILLLVKDTGQGRILYDALEMEVPPIEVPLAQWQLDQDIGPIQLRRAIVVPNTKLAYLARLAFGEGDYRVFYNDMTSAVTWLSEGPPVFCDLRNTIPRLVRITRGHHEIHFPSGNLILDLNIPAFADGWVKLLSCNGDQFVVDGYHTYEKGFTAYQMVIRHPDTVRYFSSIVQANLANEKGEIVRPLELDQFKGAFAASLIQLPVTPGLSLGRYIYTINGHWQGTQRYEVSVSSLTYYPGASYREPTFRANWVFDHCQ